MDRGHLAATVLGFIGAFAVIGILLYVVGVDAFVAEVTRADQRVLALVLLATLGWLLAWGLGMRTVLAVLGIEVSVAQSFLVVNGAMFANNITPFGQAGGEPVTALLISTITGTEYERALAAIASLDTLNFVPSISLALLGTAYYATQVTFTRRLRAATLVIVGLPVVILVVGYVLWRKRDPLADRLVGVLTPVARRLSGLVPGAPRVTRRAIAARVEHFVAAVGRVATSRRGLALALTASAAGWGFQMTALWLSFQAIGASVPAGVLLFVVPVGAIASIAPLPGGAGGIEAVLVGVLASLPGVGIGLESVLAAVVIFRGAVYWTPVLIGGVVVSLNGVEAI
ncbi:MAG: YbhN family protein [Halobacteriales archaeon]